MVSLLKCVPIKHENELMFTLAEQYFKFNVVFHLVLHALRLHILVFKYALNVGV